MAEENLVIQDIFSRVVSGSADKIALQIKKDNQWQQVSYRQIEESSLKVSSFLIQEGFNKGEFIALVLENRPEWAIIYLGIVRAGLVCVPLDPQLNQKELENLITDCQAKAVFISNSVFLNKNIRAIKQVFKKIIILDADIKEDNIISFSQISHICADSINWPRLQASDIASLIYTSGTTALPKGVLLTHANLCSNAISIQKLNIVFTSDNFLSILPLYHTYAFMITLLVPLFLGAKVTYCASFRPEDLAGILKEGQVTILVGVPQLFFMLHKSIFEKIKKVPIVLRPLLLPFMKIKLKEHFGKALRMFASGGARLEPKVAKDLSGLGFKLIEGYGLTETSPVVTFNPPKKPKFGSVGKSILGVEIRIFNPDKTGIGEVLIKGPNVMQGYFKHPDLTQEVIKDGWFYSGDLGRIDKEGYLYLVGREKDVIVLSSGKNIYPDELQDYYGRSPYIKEICILSRPDEKFGRLQESLYAVIVPNLEYFRLKNEKNIQTTIRWEVENLAKQLPSYKHIMGFIITKEELPRTRLKKIKRYEVSQKYLKSQKPEQELKEIVFSPEDLKLLDTGLAKKIIDYLSSELKRAVSLDSHLEIDLGIDSLSRVELGLGLEKLLRLKLGENFIDNVSTVRDIIAGIQGLEKNLSQETYQQEGLAQKSWNQIINELPPEAILKKINLSVGFLDKAFFFIFKTILLFIFRLFWLLRIEKKITLPSSGPYIICPNHASYLDAFFVFSSLPFKNTVNTFFLGHTDILEHPSISWATKIAHLISVDPTTHLTESMQAAAYVLRKNKIICIFPEGRRSIDEKIGEFKKGIGILAKELNVPLVPVYIKGSHYSWPRGTKFMRPYPIKVIFGRPIKWQDLGSDYEAIAEGLKREVIRLNPLA